jgi:hypothetical protein
LKSAGGFATIGNELLNFMKPSQSIPNYPEEETDTISYGYYLEKFSYIYDETSKIYSDGTLVETNSNPYCVFQYLTSELYIDNDTG